MSVSEKKKDFNWRAAEADVEERGGDLDMLYTWDDKHRDAYLRENRVTPSSFSSSCTALVREGWATYNVSDALLREPASEMATT